MLKTMSLDRASAANAALEGQGGARARADDQSAGTLSLTESHERRPLTMHSVVGAGILECSGLSPRECGILELIGQGYSNKKVARTLGITAETVKSHVKHVFIKLDVNTRAHAVVRAQRLGLVALEFERSAASAPLRGDSVIAGDERTCPP